MIDSRSLSGCQTTGPEGTARKWIKTAWGLGDLLDVVSRAAVMAQASVVHPLTQVSQNPPHTFRPYLIEIYISTIYPDCFFFYIFNFGIFL